MELPEITWGHVIWMVGFAMTAIFIGLMSFSQGEPDYKDWLITTLGIGFEAFGVELVDGVYAALIPLGLLIFLGTSVRFMPNNSKSLRIRNWKGTSLAFCIFIIFVFIQSFILLLAYRGWLDIIVQSPG